MAGLFMWRAIPPWGPSLEIPALEIGDSHLIRNRSVAVPDFEARIKWLSPIKEPDFVMFASFAVIFA